MRFRPCAADGHLGYAPALVFAFLQRTLEHPVSRVILSAAIVISLVPHQWMHTSDAWFLVLFGPEVLARSVLVFRKESLPLEGGQRMQTGWRRATGMEVFLLVLDVAALLSFLPTAASGLVGARWLRLFRLTRTILLLRYWAPVVRDLWTVSWRPERRRQLMFVFGSLILICFAGAVLLDHVTTTVGDDFDGDGVVGDPHDHEFFVRMWWAFRQMEDPGNLLASPHDTGTVVVSVFLTLAGLFVVSFIIGIGSDVVVDLAKLGRLRAPGLARHTVIINGQRTGKRLLHELLHEEYKVLPAGGGFVGVRWFVQLWRNLRRRHAIVMVGPGAERPDFLSEPGYGAVIYRAWDDDDDDTLLARADVLRARRVVLLAREGDEQSDDATVRTLLTVVEQLRDAGDQDPRRLLVEIINQDNLPAARRAASRAEAPLETMVVPTEVLIARCVAAVCRRQGLAGLLTQLLRSEGREIYTWERAPGSAVGFTACGGAAPLEALAQAGSVGLGERGVVPLGLVVAGPGGASEARLNPEPVDVAAVRGVIAIADDAQRVAEIVGAQAGAAPRQPSPRVQAQFTVEAAVPLRRMLICGFRGATVQLLESLLLHAPADAAVSVLLADDEHREQALELFAAQGALVRQGLSSPKFGAFEVDEDEGVTWTAPAGDDRRLSVALHVADWASPRVLGELPGAGESILDHDLVLFSADGSGESDARNTTGLMTYEALAAAAADAGQGERRPRVVAEVDDVELAARLNDRFHSMDRPEIHVFSIDELRALVVFQSVVVPHFNSIYEELLTGSRGLVPLRASEFGAARVPHAALGETLRASGHVLVAVDQGEGPEFGAGSSDAAVDLERARLWVLRR